MNKNKLIKELEKEYVKEGTILEDTEINQKVCKMINLVNSHKHSTTEEKKNGKEWYNIYKYNIRNIFIDSCFWYLY